jgi:hypothetical protein
MREFVRRLGWEVHYWSHSLVWGVVGITGEVFRETYFLGLDRGFSQGHKHVGNKQIVFFQIFNTNSLSHRQLLRMVGRDSWQFSLSIPFLHLW